MLVISSTFPVLHLNMDFSHSLTFLIVRHNAFTMREPGGIRSCGMVRNRAYDTKGSIHSVILPVTRWMEFTFWQSVTFVIDREILEEMT